MFSPVDIPMKNNSKIHLLITLKSTAMKTTMKLLTLVWMIISLGACKKEGSIEPDRIHKPGTGEQLSKLREDARKGMTQIFDLEIPDLNSTVNFTSESGANVRISGLTKGGNPVEGAVRIEFIEIYTGGQMAVSNRTTMGLDQEGNLVPIITGGAFYIQAYQDGNKLDENAFIQMDVPADLTGGLDPEMILWKGEIDEEDNLTWITLDDVGQKGELGMGRDQDGEGGVYHAVFGGFGWTNIDKYMSDPREKTYIKVFVPEGFSNQNSLVYFREKGEKHALARMDVYDEDEKFFSEHYGWVPIGMEAHLIFASARSDGKWLVGIKSITVDANGNYTFTDNDTQVVNSDEEMTQMIDALP